MSLVDLPTARAHLRVESDYPEAQVAIYLAAAESAAAEFLNRRVYATPDALAAAVDSVPDALVAAGAAYQAALGVAYEIVDATAQCAALRNAHATYEAAQATAQETYDGIVVNDAIKAAILLILGHLFENRQENVSGTIIAELKFGARSLLMPFRRGWGV